MLVEKPRFLMNRQGKIRRVHFVGIGGIGMGGIAEVMKHLGYDISGSDVQPNAMTHQLEELGVKVFIGHAATNINGCDVVVRSTAIHEENPEIIAARELGIPIVRRAEMLGELMRFRQGIAIAGTHGKTTTTSLCACLLAEGGLEPTFVIGGRLNSIGTNAGLGSGDYLVAEADESDASFLHLQPIITIVTNIDADHMETYGGDFEKLKETFINFLLQLPFYGLAVLCLDDPVIRDILPRLSKPVLTYGLTPQADIYATEIVQTGKTTHFKVSKKDDPDWLEVTLNLPGRHNVSNALAAIAVAHEVGVSDVAIGKALQSFEGIGRRSQLVGEVETLKGKILLIDDYGHHPREIEATIEAIRQGWTGRRLVTVFQPHRYSRTRDLFADFVQVLEKQEVLVLLEIYPAGEPPIVGADGMSLFRAICAKNPALNAHFADKPAHVPRLLLDIIQDGDIVLTLGAGNIGSLAMMLPEHLAIPIEKSEIF
jgi:UDP-N-acetylmuramate--alanine ligase